VFYCFTLSFLLFLGIDDDELDQYFFTPEESKQKERIWMRLNGTFLEVQYYYCFTTFFILKEQQRRRREREELAERERADPSVRQRAKRKKRKPQTQANTGAEAINMIIQVQS
jgi:hypothetical protein